MERVSIRDNQRMLQASNLNKQPQPQTITTRKLSITKPVKPAAHKDLSSSMERIRQRRREALLSGQYRTAEYWAYRALSSDSNDGVDDGQDLLALLQVFHNAGQYERCLAVMDSTVHSKESDGDVQWRVMRARCLVKLGRWDDALAAVDEGDISVSTTNDRQLTSQLHCVLGGILLHMGHTVRAGEEFGRALVADPWNVVAFDSLIDAHLLNVAEEHALLKRLKPLLDGDEATAFMYQSRLAYAQCSVEFAAKFDEQVRAHALGGDLGMAVTRAELLYEHHHFDECEAVLHEVLEQDPFMEPAFKLYVTVLGVLKRKMDLFRLGHRWTEARPHNPLSWYAVGTYYLLSGKYGEARRYYSHATSIEPAFVEGWVGFGHAFAADGEHDQAITAYNTANRLFPGSHRTLLYAGMQYTKLGQWELAHERLSRALATSAGAEHDPALLNEIGCVMLARGELDRARTFLERADRRAADLRMDMCTRASILVNLGHVHRRVKAWAEAKRAYEHALELNPQQGGVRACLGLVLQSVGGPSNLSEAVRLYHEALAMDAADGSVVQGLLDRAMREYLEVAMDAEGSAGGVVSSESGAINTNDVNTSNAASAHPRRASTRLRTASGTK